MSSKKLFIWNVWGLNSRVRRDAVCEFLLQERVSVACLIETKLDVFTLATANDLAGSSFDYVCVPSSGASGGIVVAWCHNAWAVSRRVCRRFSVVVDIAPLGMSDTPWSLATVYGPVDESLKHEFLAELSEISDDCPGPLLIVGDFNMIYQATDKRNSHLNLRSMRRFRRTLDAMQVDELYLHGRLYTWSNHRHRPTLEQIDRAFANVLWLQSYADHHLRTLSTDCSDHAPLLLQLRVTPWALPRFRFEGFWVRLEGFEEVVSQAWSCTLTNIDACRVIDFKLRRTAKALKSWSMMNVGRVRLQLFMAQELVAQFDAAQERRDLTPDERSLHQDLKRKSLGLASMA